LQPIERENVDCRRFRTAAYKGNGAREAEKALPIAAYLGGGAPVGYQANDTPSSERECPKCKSQNIHRAHYSPYELPLRLFFIRPYRCKRFWGFRLKLALRVAYYGILAIVCLGCIWYVIAQFGHVRDSN
jgi:hypothetical protein